MAAYSIIQKSQLEGAKRLDAEYYQPEYLILDSLRKVSGNILSEVAHCISGFAFPSEEFCKEGESPMVKMTQIVGDGFVNLKNSEYLSREYCRKFSDICRSFETRRGDIVVALTGATIGKSGIVLSDHALLNQRVLLCRAKTVSTGYLWALLSSKIFQSFIIRGALGGAQPNVSPKYATSFFVPSISEKIGIEIKDLTDKSIDLLEESDSRYSQAEDLFLEKLGLKDFKANEDLYSVVNFSDIQGVNRMDAEYFQPKYEKLISVSRAHGGKALGELVTVKKGFEPGADAYEDDGKLFIRVSNISKHELIDKDPKYINKKLYEELKKEYEPKRGEILLTKDASPGVAYALDVAVEGIISSGILRLKLKEEINPDYLALCINSVVGQMQVERDEGGSVIAHWKPEQVKNLLVPILSKPIQQSIAELVRQSHEARKQAQELLEEAKHKVEEMIENQK